MSTDRFDKTGNDALDAAFAAARTARPLPSVALMAAIAADAAREAAAARPRPAPARPRPARAAARPRAGFWRALGGWPAAGTLAASLLFGVGVGAQQAVPLSALDLLGPAARTAGDTDLADLLPGIDAFLTEG